MNNSQAILTPLKYHALFGQALNLAEIYLWQFQTSLPKSQIKNMLDALVKSNQIKYQSDYYFPPALDIDISQQSIYRFLAGRKLSLAYSTAKQLKIPSNLVFIGLSGSVAAGFAHPDDDIDLVVITQPESLWLSRLQFHLFNRRLPKRRPNQTHRLKNLFCLNLWLEADRAVMPKNIFFAHELLSVIPLYDPYDFYSHWLSQNRWVKDFFPVMYRLKIGQGSIFKPRFPSPPLQLLNYLAYLSQRLYMSPKQTTEKVNYHQAFFHAKDYNRFILDKLSQK
ncbi:MAG: nucleotidyltransferase domain-containing protein [bacterium]|nr:nucleotidyltransferase domain-containing protein [bacterium]